MSQPLPVFPRPPMAATERRDASPGAAPAPKRYAVHSCFLTICGEGYHAGQVAVFVRLSGCDIWSGAEKDRARDAEKHSPCAAICDTVFAGINEENGGGRYTAEQLLAKCEELWAGRNPVRHVVFTGGEPGLQLDDELVYLFNHGGWYTAAETNGAHVLPAALAWVTCSPKPPKLLLVTDIDELKLLYPLFNPAPFTSGLLQSNHGLDGYIKHFWLMPVEPRRPGPDGNQWDAVAASVTARSNVQLATKYVLEHPEWRLGIQAHKVWNIP